MFQIGIPQLIWLAITFIATAYSVAHDGQPKKPAKHSGPSSIIGAVLGLGLLYWGGFFG